MNSLSWDNIQKQSDEILSDGLFELLTNPIYDIAIPADNGNGNYLITLEKKPFYIGEAKELRKRINQQFKTSTSTFYKNYLKLQKTNQIIRPESIDGFKTQIISTSFGRKEVEEFGIVNLSTSLNRFQLNKRKKFTIVSQKGLWNKVQQASSDLLKEGETKVLSNRFTPWFDTEILSNAGLYLVKDKMDKLIYVGESSDVGDRISTHSRRTYFSALRRHIGTEILKFQLKEINGKKKYFSELEDRNVTDFLKTCKSSVFAVNFGRYELEEYLIRKHKPLLNRKDNKNE